jgi:hypothetical protein
MGQFKTKYGLNFPVQWSQLEMEMHMVRKGGQWTGKDGNQKGNGLLFHFMELQKLLFGKAKVWHVWNETQAEQYLKCRTLGILGPASSGKSCSAATDALADYYCYPDCTTVLVCSTTKERMQDRIFGEIKKYHRIARERWPYLPGHAIDGRMRIVTEGRDDARDGRDFRNGIIGVPCLSGGDFKGISEFIGIKNKRVRAIIDELQMIPPSVLLAISNLDKNPDFKLVGLGNPKETTDALGQLCEPAHWLGGWDGGIDQEPKTKTWATSRPDGVCLQLVGTDSPNLDGKLGIDLITQAAIDRDVEQYGRDSLQFTMMNQGMMPRGQGSRRVLTAQLCKKNGAMDEPIWLNSNRTKVASLDAAYGGAGGDRCILSFLEFGPEAETEDNAQVALNLVMQDTSKKKRRILIALMETMVVPIKPLDESRPEEQIVNFVQTQCSTRGVPPNHFFYDSGMRTSLVSAFADRWSTKTNPIDCGGTPSKDKMVSVQIQKPCDKYYSKFITEIWFNVRYAVEARQFKGMTQPAMMEFCSREWTMVMGNKIEVEPKRKMKEKLGKSPDVADSIAIGVLGAIRLGFAIDSLKPPSEKSENGRWKKDHQNRSKSFWSHGNITPA